MVRQRGLLVTARAIIDSERGSRRFNLSGFSNLFSPSLPVLALEGRPRWRVASRAEGDFRVQFNLLTFATSSPFGIITLLIDTSN